MGRAKADDTRRYKKALLEAFAICGNVTQACKLANVGRATHYEWLKDDPEYANAFDDALEQATDHLEQEARRRAVEGTVKPVFYKGDECGYIREYSDTLLIFLLKGAKPEKYRENVRAELGGLDGKPFEVNIKVVD